MNNQLPLCCLPRKKRSPGQTIGIFVLIFTLFFILDRFGLLVFSPGTKTLAGLGSVFLFGIAASLSTCTVFSAGLLAALAVKEERRVRRQALFHIGRLVGFVAFGAVIGLVGSKITLSLVGQNVLVLAVSFALFFTSLNILGLLPEQLANHPFFLRIKERLFVRSQLDNQAAPLLLGAITFFLPCGFTQSAQLYALSLASPPASSLAMLVFALGSLPVLLGIGVVVSFSQGIWHKRIRAAAGVLMILLSLSGFQNSLVLANWFAPTGAASLTSAGVKAGEQFIEMTVYEDAYEPNILRVKAGLPVVWRIYGSDNMGCAQSLVSRALGIEAELQPGLNEFTFTPTKAGTYRFSCAMGMVRGKIIVE